MRNCLLVLICIAVVACAGPHAASEGTRALFDDSLFSPPSERVGADGIFALSDEMRRYLAQPSTEQLMRSKGAGRGLLGALYDSGELKLEYEASSTRNAAQAFDARAGNCLSLLVMTAAFAKELGLQVRYQSAYLAESVSRSNDLLLRSGHVNITLMPRFTDARDLSMTVDFLPPEELRGLSWREISEATVVAMFMNNRAVEAVIAGRLDDAYAWAREATLQDGQFLEAVNTLGLVFLRRGALPQATAAFSYVLQRDEMNRSALANLATAYARQGRMEESSELQRRLVQLEPEPPLYYFSLGLAAMKHRDFRTARELFSRELAREHDYDELHYWLGRANFELGDYELAIKHLDHAVALSGTRHRRDLYSAKLQLIRDLGAR